MLVHDEDARLPTIRSNNEQIASLLEGEPGIINICHFEHMGQTPVGGGLILSMTSQ
jgi:hypothetical protein